MAISFTQVPTCCKTAWLTRACRVGGVAPAMHATQSAWLHERDHVGFWDLKLRGQPHAGVLQTSGVSGDAWRSSDGIAFVPPSAMNNSQPDHGDYGPERPSGVLLSQTTERSSWFYGTARRSATLSQAVPGCYVVVKQPDSHRPAGPANAQLAGVYLLLVLILFNAWRCAASSVARIDAC